MASTRLTFGLVVLAALWVSAPEQAIAQVGPTSQPVQGLEDDWRWSDQEAGPLYGAYRAASNYDVALTLNRGVFPTLTIRLAKDGKELYTWQGHARTVFYDLRGVLYYARFNPTTSGGDIVAVDLATGQTLWESPLRALGPVAHSGYSNRINLQAHFDEVRVFGWEGNGRYIETKNARTGETIRHAVLPVNPPTQGAVRE